MRAVGPADSMLVAKNVYARMFNSITLPSDSEQKALSVIRTAFVKMVGMHMLTESAWQSYVGTQARRDTTLANLIADSSARKRFWRHAQAAMPQKPAYVKPDSSGTWTQLVRETPTLIPTPGRR